MTVDPAGDVWTGLVSLHYVDDPVMRFIQKFDATGTHLRSFFRDVNPGFYFERVRQVEVEPGTGNVWSADSRLDRVQEFDPNGVLLDEINGVGEPAGIALHGGSLYVADAAGHQIHCIDPNGVHTAWGGPGSGDGQLWLFETSGLAVDGAGNVYVADTFNDRIQEFSPDGTFLGKFGASGTAPGEFRQPTDVAFSPDFRILHVVDRANHRVQSFCMPGVAPGLCTDQMDADGDGALDAQDSCAFTSNPLQEDTGSLGAPVPDGIGDACQCGEVTGNGVVDVDDLAAVRVQLASASPGFPDGRCSVAGDTGCDVLDVVVLARALQGLRPGVAQVCAAAVRAP